ncbi:MAG TPA: single-stranded DNA-binding protein [Chitinophagales bacterium]|mgnify:FL=1|nr:single-stranded DNA-binding protein [Chitinophagales bacterium]
MVNKVFLIGRLGKDPVVKHFSNDNAIAEFTLATDDSYKDKQGNKVEQTDWHNIKIPTRKLAEVAEKYLRKGSLIHVEGKIKTRSYDDKDGNKRYITEIVADTFKMLDSKKDNAGGGGGNYSSSNNNTSYSEQAPASTPAVDDDLPF